MSFSPTLKRWFFLLALGLLLGLRFFHFGELIDGPHTWRQCDTAQYIHAFAEEGIDLLHPSVCWMGGHKTLILEFPLHEAVVAVFYRLFGASHVWARLVTLLFFMGALRYLYLLLRELSTEDTARWAILVYAAMPLSIYFSRAIHIDFAAVFFAHGMVWYFFRGIRDRKPIQMLAGVAFAALAFLVKVPYAFYFALPLLFVVFHYRRWLWVLKWLPLMLGPVLLFWFWEQHVVRVNASAPDWGFIPDYHKFDQMAYWYLGSWAQRLDPTNWDLLWGRLRHEIMGTMGMVLLVFGAFFGAKDKPFRAFGLLWLLAVAAYVMIFFNLNKVHNYYQIPLMAPLAWGIGRGLKGISDLFPNSLTVFRWLPALVLFGLFAGKHISYTEQNYYKVGLVPVGAGHFIQQATEPDDLIIATYGGLDSRAPHVLYRSRRYGWQIMEMFMKGGLVERLRQEGADYLALVRREPPTGELSDYLRGFPRQDFDLKTDGWMLFLYELERESEFPD